MRRQLRALALVVAITAPAFAGLPEEFHAVLASADGGAPVRLPDLKGKVVLLDFWTTFCEPCRDAKPFFESLQKRFGERGLVVLAVDAAEEPAVVKAYLKEHPTPLKVVLDPRGSLAKSLRLRKQPGMALFDMHDDLEWSAVGFSPATKQELEWRLDHLLPGERGSVPIGALK